jgi:Protein of unknown function (DUF2000)
MTVIVTNDVRCRFHVTEPGNIVDHMTSTTIRPPSPPLLVPERLAIVLDGTLPAGLAANAAAVLALTLGRHTDGVLGPDVPDADGRAHRGITALTVPVLSATPDELRGLVTAADAAEGVLAVDFASVAQAARRYEDYVDALATAGTAEHSYVGVGLAGPKRAVSRLVGNFRLYR